MFVGVAGACCIQYFLVSHVLFGNWSSNGGLTSNWAEPSCDLFKERWRQTKCVTVQSIGPASKSGKGAAMWAAPLAGDVEGLADCVKGKHACPDSGVQKRALSIQTREWTHLHMQIRAGQKRGTSTNAHFCVSFRRFLRFLSKDQLHTDQSFINTFSIRSPLLQDCLIHLPQ